MKYFFEIWILIRRSSDGFGVPLVKVPCGDLLLIWRFEAIEIRALIHVFSEPLFCPLLFFSLNYTVAHIRYFRRLGVGVFPPWILYFALRVGGMSTKHLATFPKPTRFI
jgi:hypothetical protein